MATGGGPPKPSAPKGSTQSDKEEEEGAPAEPSLLCVQCTHELRDPHLLCCLHCVCAECLGRMEQQGGHLKCPKCGDTSTHPPQGQHSVRTCRPSTAEVQCVPVRCVSLAQHIEDRKLFQKIASGEQVLCSNSVCDNPGSHAVVVCFKCEEYLCETCNTAHRIMSKKLFSEGHTVKSLSELRSLPPSVLWSLVPQSVTPATCPCHEGEPLKYYCEQCDTLLCQACTVDKGLRHQPRYLNRAAVAQHAQCLVVAREAVVRSGEVHQKTAARLEAQSTAVDEMREGHSKTHSEQFTQCMKLLIGRKRSFATELFQCQMRRSTPLQQGPRAVTKRWSPLLLPRPPSPSSSPRAAVTRWWAARNWPTRGSLQPPHSAEGEVVEPRCPQW